MDDPLKEIFIKVYKKNQLEQRNRSCRLCVCATGDLVCLRSVSVISLFRARGGGAGGGGKNGNDKLV